MGSPGAPPRSVTTDERFMREAIRLSLAPMLRGQGGPFGAFVVRDGEIVGRGWNQVTLANDPTAHAEILAIREACRHLRDFRLRGCTLYASCEPCPMCLAAVYWARIERLCFAATRRDAAAAGFDDERILREIRRPAAERPLPATQLLRDEAAVAFEAWRALPGRRPY